MPSIKFSHEYPKLHGQVRAELLDVRVTAAEDVQKNKELIEYDTMYEDETGERDHFGTPITKVGYYPLPKKGFLLQLIFLGNKKIPFCTLRRKTDEKMDYYTELLGEEFDIEIVKEVKK